MLAINNSSLNNMYVNQNGYGQQTMKPYSFQQTSMFGLNQSMFVQQPLNFYGNQSMFSQPQQITSSNSSNLLLSLLTSILPMLLGSSSGYAQAPVNNQPPLGYALPGTNINNWGNIGNINIGGQATQNPFGGLLGYSQPPKNSSSNMLQQLMKELFSLISPTGTNGKKPVEVYQDELKVESAATGDPHFAINGQQSFDFQGKNGNTYKMLENSDISLNAKFNGGGDGLATVITAQNLEFKDKGINIVSHADGKFEILLNGKKVGDETTYNTDKSVIDLLKNNGIDVKKEGKNLTTTYGKRTLVQSLNGGNIDNINNTLMKEDKGLLSQTVGAIDEDKDGKTNLGMDLNNDKKVDEKDTLNYDLKDQFMVHTEMQATSCATITPEIEAAIKKDIEAGAKLGSAVKGFSTQHGYDARQWNEYIGGKLYTTTDELLK